MIDERRMYDYDNESITHLTKDISLIKEFMIDIEGDNKKYLTEISVVVNNEIITSKYFETIQFIEQLKLFHKVEVDSKYFKLVKKDNQNSLLLITQSDEKIFISESEARAATAIFSMSLHGYSFKILLESVYIDEETRIKSIKHVIKKMKDEREQVLKM
jgi:hypothetical protein